MFNSRSDVIFSPQNFTWTDFWGSIYTPYTPVATPLVLGPNISKTVRDTVTRLVPLDHQQEMAYGESNVRHVLNNVTPASN